MYRQILFNRPIGYLPIICHIGSAEYRYRQNFQTLISFALYQQDQPKQQQQTPPAADFATKQEAAASSAKRLKRRTAAAASSTAPKSKSAKSEEDEDAKPPKAPEFVSAAKPFFVLEGEDFVKQEKEEVKSILRFAEVPGWRERTVSNR